MKERLTLRNVVIWGAAFLGLLFFFLSFAAKAQLYGPAEGDQAAYIIRNAIWSCNFLEVRINGEYIAGNYVTGKPFVLPIIGIILLLLAVLGAVAISFFVKDNKLAKILLIVCGGLAIVGGVFVFFVGESALRTFAYEMFGEEGLKEIDSLRAEMKGNGWNEGPRALSVIIGVVAILAGAAFGVAPFLPEKKLVK